MATVCELSAQFNEPLLDMYDLFRQNLQAASRWGTRWDIVRDEQYSTVEGAQVRQIWGFSSAYARMDGMGGYVSFLVTFTQHGTGTEVRAVVSSPYERNGKNSAYFRRNHQVALRLLEFSVAPYEEIHPRLRAIKRWAGQWQGTPTRSHST